MKHQLLRIVQVSTIDNGGGAARVAWNLHQAYQRRGIHAWLAVGRKFGDSSTVVVIPNKGARSHFARILLRASQIFHALECWFHGTWKFAKILQCAAEPGRQRDICKGIEDFHYPGTWRLLRLFPKVPDIIHCHNLHGGYFDLRALPWLSHQRPVILTLHDAWLISGHCAHSFDCERWKTGCGQCPDLSVYPAIKRDSTGYNWRRKREIYAKSRLYVATPSRWLMQKVEQSILVPALVEGRVINNGVDLSVFHPTDRRAVRGALGIRSDVKVILFGADRFRKDSWKDSETMYGALTLVAKNLHGKGIVFIGLGEDGPPERIGQVEVRFIPYQIEPDAMARYYQAANIYLHSTKADTFPNMVLESLACGTPVVATAVGGIPEQVKGLKADSCRFEGEGWELNRYKYSDATGLLVRAGDVKGMASAIVALLSNKVQRERLSENAARDTRQRFDLNRQVEDYLEWYHEIAERWNLERSSLGLSNSPQSSFRTSLM